MTKVSIRQIIISIVTIGLVIITSWVPLTSAVHHEPEAKRVQTTIPTTQIKKVKAIIHKDMRSVKGTWSVKVTSLTNPQIKVTASNHGIKSQRSASTIKVYVMLAAYYQVKQHQLKLTPTINSNLRRMIHYSDNNATNYLIRKLGGFKKINRIVHRFGFQHSNLRRLMLDSYALAHHRDNYTNVNDLTTFLTKTYRHQLLGQTYDSKMLTLLHGCQNHSKLPKLVRHAKIYNKTGEFPDKGVQNDAALFKTNRGVFTIVVMSQSGQQYYQYSAMNHLGKDVINYLNHSA